MIAQRKSKSSESSSWQNWIVVDFSILLECYHSSMESSILLKNKYLHRPVLCRCAIYWSSEQKCEERHWNKNVKKDIGTKMCHTVFTL
jgi:hypothetical protein